jgi:hypothetical protein
MRAYMTAVRWGFPVPGEPIASDALFATDIEISAPARIPLDGEYDEEVRFVVEWRSLWREDTGAPPGPRLRFVYIGRDAGGDWQVIGGGTGP